VLSSAHGRHHGTCSTRRTSDGGATTGRFAPTRTWGIALLDCPTLGRQPPGRLRLGPALATAGREGLASPPAPRTPPPKLARRELARLPQWLARGDEAYGFASPIWTTQRVADLIWRRFRVRYDRDHVCRLLHRFGWGWQKPARRARERVEPAIRRWVEEAWPGLKETPEG
jgi:transposase